MFSGLINSYTNYRNREVNSADTRLGLLKREANDGGSEQRAPKKDYKDSLDGMDEAQVSIESLRCFLEGFLKSMSDDLCKEEAKRNNVEIPDMQRMEDAKAECAAGSHEALSAYQQAQGLTGPCAKLSSADTKMTANSLGLSIDEVRTVFLLIEDLRDLEARGMDSLSIERSDTFLGSLVEAVKRVKTLS